jgi:Raf kinase inhibitor-like YbhB/YbcL family protein
VIIGLTMLAVAVAACDEGDGKTLETYDPADYPSQTDPPPTVESFEVGTGIGASVTPTLPAGDPAAAAALFEVSAPWAQGASIDPRYTCDGDDLAPAVSWSGTPGGTSEIALALVDDSEVSEGEPFVHWVIAGLNPGDLAIVEDDVPTGAIQAINFMGNVDYDGPCPPRGDEPHVYRLTAYALSQATGVADGAAAADVLDAIEQATIATADLSATYER